MQSNNDVILSYDEMNNMVGEMLEKKGFIGPGNSVKVSVLRVDTYRGEGYSLRVSITSPDAQEMPDGPISR